MLKVLLCSPFEQVSGIVSGGINIWGKNILDYYEMTTRDVELDAISYDRKYEVKEQSSKFERAYYGVIEYGAAIRKTKKQIKRKQYDVVHLCTSAQLSLFKDYLVVRMAKKFRCRSVVHFHFGRIPELIEKHNWEWKMICKIAYNATSIVVMDQKSYEALLQAKINNVHYLPNPLSLSITSQIVEQKDAIAKQQRKVVFVGHVILTKGVYELVKACKELEDVELHLIGTIDDIVRRDLEEIASEKMQGTWLKIRGCMPHEKVIEEMLSAQIFALPSYTEGFPNVILESMACGCAIVATPVGAIPEMLDVDNEVPCGFISKVKDVEGLRMNISTLLGDSELSKTLGERAEVRARNMYSMPTIWNQLVSIWKL